MGVRELIDKLRGLGKEDEEEEYEAKPIIDRQLDSLRREREYQMNIEEKIRLKKHIAEYKQDQMKRHLYGIDDKKEKLKSYLGDVQNKKVQVLKKKQELFKQNSILQQKSILRNSLLDNKKKEFRKRKQQKNFFV